MTIKEKLIFDIFNELANSDGLVDSILNVVDTDNNGKYRFEKEEYNDIKGQYTLYGKAAGELVDLFFNNAGISPNTEISESSNLASDLLMKFISKDSE